MKETFSQFHADCNGVGDHSRQGHNQRRSFLRPWAFTLTEMLVVVFIIMILLGMVTGLVTYANHSAALARIKADIRNIELWLQAYKNDTGTFPMNKLSFTSSSTTADYTAAANTGTLSNLVWRALWYNPSVGVGAVKVPYGQFRVEQLSGSGSFTTYIIDPWSTPILYDATSPFPSVRKNPTYDLWSFGKDKLSDRGTDTYNKDDIGNFMPP